MFSADWGNNGLNPIGGSHWFRQDVTITDIAPGSDAILRLGCIVDADSVYVNGIFIGNTTYQYPPRIYRIPAGVLKPDKTILLYASSAMVANQVLSKKSPIK